MQMKEGIRGWVEVEVDAVIKGKGIFREQSRALHNQSSTSHPGTQTPGPVQRYARSCGNPQGEHVTAAQGFFEFIQCYVHFS